MKVIYDSRKDIHLTATGSASPILEKGSLEIIGQASYPIDEVN